jgi:predicted enzyme related to lactoylglutathione lyase
VRVRTVYFKTPRIAEAVAWWSHVLDAKPTKVFPPWQEFRLGEINLGFLKVEPGSTSGRASCVPVIEFTDSEIETRIARAKAAGATVILEGESHPDHPRPAAVLVDPFGNEFEFTCLHD